MSFIDYIKIDTYRDSLGSERIPILFRCSN